VVVSLVLVLNVFLDFCVCILDVYILECVCVSVDT